MMPLPEDLLSARADLPFESSFRSVRLRQVNPISNSSSTWGLIDPARSSTLGLHSPTQWEFWLRRNFGSYSQPLNHRANAARQSLKQSDSVTDAFLNLLGT
ncbi:hypothetical protein FNV43_RR10008 [Rhamnella rubrinervis]|uniref:Uncharacterized protein n=1 Tax=Rhamnella rubrinervis TaxID=2594499 RepID=A0A8K0HCB5_9ROSA|nr:hypothetical protein FNV43_RR10008 [Rhamnella rubrinervis]